MQHCVLGAAQQLTALNLGKKLHHTGHSWNLMDTLKIMMWLKRSAAKPLEPAVRLRTLVPWSFMKKHAWSYKCEIIRASQGVWVNQTCSRLWTPIILKHSYHTRLKWAQAVNHGRSKLRNIRIHREEPCHINFMHVWMTILYSYRSLSLYINIICVCVCLFTYLCNFSTTYAYLFAWVCATSMQIQWHDFNKHKFSG